MSKELEVCEANMSPRPYTKKEIEEHSPRRQEIYKLSPAEWAKAWDRATYKLRVKCGYE